MPVVGSVFKDIALREQRVDSTENLSLLNTKMSLMRKSVLPNGMALDIITASWGGTCAVIQTECFVFIADESANVPSLSKHMRIQVNALNSAIPSLPDLIKWFISWGSWWKKLLIILGLLISVCVFSYMCLYCCCGICLQCSQIAKNKPPLC